MWRGDSLAAVTLMMPLLPTITPRDFVAKWDGADFGEKQAAQEMFLDVCGMVGHRTPVAYGDSEVFTFERRVPGGFADAYLEGHFVWEFKGQDRQLSEAVVQAVGYARHLKNPPLIVASSFEIIRIETNFPGMELVQHNITLSELVEPAKLELLRNLFHNPDALRPQRSVAAVTQDTARLFSQIVADMEGHTADPELLARYLNRIVFCLYAEDAGLLPEDILADILRANRQRPDLSNRALANLFDQMAQGGLFGAHEIAHFNGDLFRGDTPVELSGGAMQRLGEAVVANWRSIEPSIFGTLFERALDASKRAQTGVHYTGAADIALVVEPVVMAPLRREWETARAEIEELLESSSSESGFSGFTDFEDGVADASITQSWQSQNPVNPASDNPPARARLESFRRRLATVTVLDPACGSGNFLYIALRSLLDLELEVIDFAAARGWPGLTPTVQPNQMLGLEINHYAAELARTALWIGYIQWHQANGFPYTQRPILTPLDTIRQTDAILDLKDPDRPAEPEWPAAEFIVGNPPFLGAKDMLTELGVDYIGRLRPTYAGELDGAVDLCCYWFEQARGQIAAGKAKRAGLLATQAIRFSSNRRTLERIKETGDIFAAYDDLEWKPEEPGSAAVHVSIVCFDDGNQTTKTLNGNPATDIDTRLTDAVNLDQAQKLPQNDAICFRGIEKGGPFDLTPEQVAIMLSDSNPNGKSNSDVIKRYVIGRDLNGRPQERWLVDFGAMPESDAKLYNLPYQHCLNYVKPVRDKNRREHRRLNWWLLNDATPALDAALAPLTRYIGTCQVSKHRCFQYIDADIAPDVTVVAFGREDDYFLGILESRFHKVWVEATGTQLREKESGRRYIISECFEKFPFPTPTESQRNAVSAAARTLDEQRRNVCRPNGVYRRSMTSLYNENPPWLRTAHAELDAAVADAYGWPPNLPDGEILERLLAENLERAAGE